MSVPSSPLAQTALEQFQLRLTVAQRRRSAGDWSVEEADARLYPWVAAALRCGADPALIHLDLAMEHADRLKSGLPDATARHLMALRFASDAELVAEMARTRDEALRTNNPHAPALATMAIRLGAPAPAGTEEKEAA